MRKRFFVLLIIAVIVCFPFKTKNQITGKEGREFKETVEELSVEVEELKKAIVDVNKALKKF